MVSLGSATVKIKRNRPLLLNKMTDLGGAPQGRGSRRPNPPKGVVLQQALNRLIFVISDRCARR